jgi:hypothetical protein
MVGTALLSLAQIVGHPVEVGVVQGMHGAQLGFTERCSGG